MAHSDISCGRNNLAAFGPKRKSVELVSAPINRIPSIRLLPAFFVGRLGDNGPRLVDNAAGHSLVGAFRKPPGQAADSICAGNTFVHELAESRRGFPDEHEQEVVLYTKKFTREMLPVTVSTSTDARSRSCRQKVPR
jgi:hypothetical protein